jgi:hypothetical protein
LHAGRASRVRVDGLYHRRGVAGVRRWLSDAGGRTRESLASSGQRPANLPGVERRSFHRDHQSDRAFVSGNRSTANSTTP